MRSMDSAGDQGGGARGGALRLLVEGSPALVGARSPKELASAAAGLARSLLGALEALVALRHGDTVDASEGEGPLAAWVSEHPPIEAPLAAGERFAVPLRSRGGQVAGVLAARRGAPLLPDEAALLEQLGALVAACAENLARHEETARSLRMRDGVISALSHNLRTPLNSLRLGASLLSDLESVEDRKIVERIDRSVSQLVVMVDNLLDVIHLDAGRMEIVPQRESVVDLLTAAQRFAEAQPEAQRVRFIVESPPAPMWVRADRRRAAQVLGNLISNAMRLTPPGREVTLRVSRHGGSARFEVQDSGPGVPEAERQHLLQGLVRSDTKKRRGFGLYLANGLVAAQGGTLWFESPPGEGAHFYFTLPCAEPPPPPPG